MIYVDILQLYFNPKLTVSKLTPNEFHSALMTDYEYDLTTTIEHLRKKPNIAECKA